MARRCSSALKKLQLIVSAVMERALRQQLVSRIVAAGGTIITLDDCGTRSLSSRRKWIGGLSSILYIGDAPTESREYLVCLAAHIPCLKSSWIQDSLCMGAPQDVSQRYLLDRGRGYLQDIPNARADHSPIIAGLRVEILGPRDSVAPWTLVYHEAGCRVLTDRVTSGRLDVAVCAQDVSIGGAQYPGQLYQDAVERNGVPLVTHAWIISTIISGKQQDLSEPAWCARSQRSLLYKHLDMCIQESERLETQLQAAIQDAENKKRKWGQLLEVSQQKIPVSPLSSMQNDKRYKTFQG